MLTEGMHQLEKDRAEYETLMAGSEALLEIIEKNKASKFGTAPSWEDEYDALLEEAENLLDDAEIICQKRADTLTLLIKELF